VKMSYAFVRLYTTLDRPRTTPNVKRKTTIRGPPGDPVSALLTSTQRSFFLRT